MVAKIKVEEINPKILYFEVNDRAKRINACVTIEYKAPKKPIIKKQTVKVITAPMAPKLLTNGQLLV